MKTTNKDLWEGLTPISVRMEDIRTAKKDNTKGRCPVYHAIMRILPQDFEVKVNRTTIQIFPRKGNKGMYGKLPWEAIEYGEEWDYNGKAKPFFFFVDFKI